MIHFTTIPLKYEGTLKNDSFCVPDSPSTEKVLNSHAVLWKDSCVGTVDPELELYNFVEERWPFMSLESRTSQRPQLPLEFSLS